MVGHLKVATNTAGTLNTGTIGSGNSEEGNHCEV
jgi:hypothetical protein